MTTVKQDRQTTMKLALSLWAHATFLEGIGEVELAQSVRLSASAATDADIYSEGKIFTVPAMKLGNVRINAAPQYIFLQSHEKGLV